MTEDEKREEAVDGGAGADPGQMSEAELREALEKQFREQDVSDMLVQYMAGLSHIAYVKMGLTEDTAGVKDLAQSSMAIDGFKALLEAVRDRIDAQDASALEGALASMQMTFAQASGGARDTSDEGASGDSAGTREHDDSSGDDGEEGGSASDRIWVPGKD